MDRTWISVVKLLANFWGIVIGIFVVIFVGVWLSYIEEARQFERNQTNKVQQ